MTFAQPRQIRSHEQMDADAADPAALRRALGFIRRINTALRYNVATIRALGELIGPTRGPVSVLDVATGSADLPADVSAWARRRGIDVTCVGLDRHATTLGIAAEWEPVVPLVRGDALSLPFADGSFDYATCAMFLHHLDTDAAVRVVREMERVTRRGWVVADLLRRWRALAWVTAFTVWAEPMVRHDARTSVRQAWSPDEARELAQRAGVEATYGEAFGHRFLLTRAKRGTDAMARA